jgi:S1-C subfamily serine protease
VALTVLPPDNGISAAAEPDIRRDATVGAVERVIASVVNIATEEIVEYSDPIERAFRGFWAPYYRRQQPNTQYSLGSGVIIDEDGYVLTNLHVVRRANRVWVKLSDGKEYEARPIVGTTRSDVALLKLVTRPGEKFKAVRFGRDDDLLLGETVLALGNPFGLGGSVSRGILSSKNRRAPKGDEPLDVADWLQTDAPINFGNSGGPLVNLRGELIGLNVAIYEEGHGIGFAIPVKQVTEALSEIFVPEVTQSLRFGARIRSGPYPLSVTAIEPGSPAEAAGLRKEDFILSVNGRTPAHFIECTELVSNSPNQETRLVVRRNGERREINVRMVPLASLLRQKLGVQVQELTPELAKQFGFKVGDGLLVAEVDSDGPAARARLRPGHLIAGIDNQASPNLLRAANIVAGKKTGDRAQLTLLVRQQAGGFARISEATASVRIR